MRGRRRGGGVPSRAMATSASRKVAYWPTCIRCVTTCVGTRTRQAATSPTDADAECCIQCSCPPFSRFSRGFMASYAEKKRAAPGAEPSAVANTPLYTPRNPPAFQKPPADWRRVLSVSSGKSATSTEVPAQPPEMSARLNGVGFFDADASLIVPPCNARGGWCPAGAPDEARREARPRSSPAPIRHVAPPPECRSPRGRRSRTRN